MKKLELLIEFTNELIEVQIEKYRKLATIGVGPDARLNAFLVMQGVRELMTLAESLIIELEKLHNTQRKVDESIYADIFNQIRFHIEQESLRGEAGWLIDANKIHNEVYERTSTQKSQLIELAKLGNIDMNTPPRAVTKFQLQCEHDSHDIAFRILDLAVKLRANPEAELGEGVPSHAVTILRKHACEKEGRYSDAQYGKRIIELYNQTKHFLEDSKLKKNENKLEKQEVEFEISNDRTRLKSVQSRYHAINPNSSISKDKPQQINTSKFFVAAASVGVMALVAYLANYLGSSSNQAPAHRM